MITGDARKLIDTFIEYAIRDSNDDLANALLYDSAELRRRAKILLEQVEASDNADE